MPRIKFVGGDGPLDIPGGDPAVVEVGGTVDVPAELAKELVDRGDFEKVNAGGSSAKKEES